jgi:hypothetical protein
MALVAYAGLAFAQSPVRRGNEFVVNSYTYGAQRRVDVASNAAGQFVVVWQTFYNSPYGNQFDIQAQRYDATGARAGGEVDVTADPVTQDHPSVGVAADGSFVVVWEDYGDGYGYRIEGKRFGVGGFPVGGDFVVNGTPGTYYNTGLATAPDGSFVVAWASYNDPADGDDAAVRARRFDTAGAPLGGDFLVNTYTTGFQDSPAIARAADGSFVIVWQDTGQDAVIGRRYDSTGAPLGGEFVVGATPPGFGNVRLAGAPDGRFVVVWATSGFGDANVTGRRYDATGAPVGGEFVVNEITTGYQGRPDVFMAPDGSFVVTWMSDSAGPDSDVMARRFDAGGTPLGGDFQVHRGHQGAAEYSSPLAIAGADDGTFVVVWRSAYDYGSQTHGTDIVGQRFANATVGCTPTPRLDCRTQTAARGVFRFTDSGVDTRDKLVWQWPKGEATELGDFGDPFTDTAFALCIYDGSANPQPLATVVSTAQGPCGNILCWMSLSGTVLRYYDPDRASDGLQQILLRAGDEGAARIGVRAKGENLALPATPLTPPVTVQMQSSAGECFTATYLSQIAKNSGGQFRARPDAP